MMVDLVDLKTAVNDVLIQAFPDHKLYAGEVSEGFERPSFFTRVLPLRKDYETVNYESNRLMVVITYFNEYDTELENLKMYDQLVGLYGSKLRVKKRWFKIWDVRQSDVDGAMQFSFDLDFHSRIIKKKDGYAPIGDVTMEVKYHKE